jgi:two-component system sensor histidine kinase DevS
VGKQQSTAAAAPREWTAGPGRPTLSDVALSATIVAGLLDTVPDGVLLIDESGQLLLMNTRIEELFGYTRADLLGRPVEELLPERLRDDHVKHRAEFGDRPRTRAMGLGLALSGRRQDGSEFPVEISLSPLVAHDRTWAVATVRDATQRQAVEEQRRDAAVIAEQARIAEELADTVIGGLFGIGLQLQGLVELANDRVAPGLQRAVEDIDGTIRAIRQSIFDLARSGDPAD